MHMLWAMATSLLIHNEGLPDGVMISFLYVLLGMSAGWFAINIHQIQMTHKASAHVEEMIKLEGPDTLGKFGSLERAIQMEKGKIALGKSFRERILSYKALHGAFMVTSLMNVIGRVFVTPLSSDFTCYTTNYYKQIDTKHFAGASAPLTPVAETDPNFMKLPWAKMGLGGWAVALGLGPFLGSFIMGMMVVVLEARFRKAQNVGSSRAVNPVEDDTTSSSVGKEKLLERAPKSSAAI
ncbi:hypothetical protein HDU93_005899 [Gonapodya sp. JEL0774]|nr:hypothetical protein HDU93_005899 [Gonapodya sp. JEL0774]